jgi:hypothetical protein
MILRIFTLMLIVLWSGQSGLPVLAAVESNSMAQHFHLTPDAYALLRPDPTPVPEIPFCGEACWSASFVLPGSGQLFLGEPLRGWGFMAGTLIAPWAISSLTMALLETFKVPGWSGAELEQAAPFFILAALIGGVSMYVWNIFDAYGLQNERILAWKTALEGLQPRLSRLQSTGELAPWHLEVRLATF